MAVIEVLASFPNTRLRPRQATRTAETYGGIAPVGTPVLVRPENRNRTYLTLRNTNVQDSMVYGYGPDANDDVFLTNNGMILRPGDSMDIDSLEEVYAMSIGVTPVTFRVDEGQG